jgi:hypothetical protein
MIARKQAKSEGADGFPVAWQWLADLGVKPGEFQVETKARLRHAMLQAGWPDRQRVHACLTLYSMGFNQEEAVKMERGGVMAPLRQVDIANETGIDIKSVHRCVVELEAEGWLKRLPADGKDGLRKGEVKIVCYVIPRKVKAAPAVDDAGAPDDAEDAAVDSLPAGLAHWAKKLKLSRYGTPNPESVARLSDLAATIDQNVERLVQEYKSAIPVNSANVAKLQTVPRRAVDLGVRAGSEKSGLGVRAVPFGGSARGRTNKVEIKEIKKLTAAAVSEGREGGEWPCAAAAVQRFFPRTEDAFVAELARLCRGHLLDAGKDPGLLTDQTLADAVAMAHKPGQHSAGLFNRTVPAVLKNWAKAKPEPERIVEYVDFVEET